jgi:hypothetical protein
MFLVFVLESTSFTNEDTSMNNQPKRFANFDVIYTYHETTGLKKLSFSRNFDKLEFPEL